MKFFSSLQFAVEMYLEKSQRKIVSWLNVYLNHSVKSARIRSYSGPYFPACGLNTKRYSVSLRIEPEYEKNSDQNNFVYVHFYAVSV